MFFYRQEFIYPLVLWLAWPQPLLNKFSFEAAGERPVNQAVWSGYGIMILIENIFRWGEADTGWHHIRGGR